MTCNLANRCRVLMTYQTRSQALSPLSEPGIEVMTYPDLILSDVDPGFQINHVAWVNNQLGTGYSCFLRKVSFNLIFQNSPEQKETVIIVRA